MESAEKKARQAPGFSSIEWFFSWFPLKRLCERPCEAEFTIIQ
jgi:hypothetical protein